MFCPTPFLVWPTMFRKTQTTSVSGRDEVSTTLELRDVLRDRLRLAFAFATLGAYEDDEQELRHERDTQEELCGAGHVVDLRHAQGKVQLCDAGGAARCSTLKSGEFSVAVKRSRFEQSRSKQRRGGQVTAPQQPCVW
jgi:hypothetical protein